MPAEPKEKNLELERLVLFSDAVVAIAITLLALDLKVVPAGAHLAYADLFHTWHKFAAFFLSFVIIAVFWVNHHRFFVYIKDIDSTLMTYNICWLMFIVLLPFSSTLVSADFFNKPGMMIYSINVLLVTCFQTVIWRHVTHHRTLLKDNCTESVMWEFRVGCYLAMANVFLAIGIALFSPLLAFIILFTRSVMYRRGAQKYIARLTARKEAKERKAGSEEQR